LSTPDEAEGRAELPPAKQKEEWSYDSIVEWMIWLTAPRRAATFMDSVDEFCRGMFLLSWLANGILICVFFVHLDKTDASLYGAKTVHHEIAISIERLTGSLVCLGCLILVVLNCIAVRLLVIMRRPWSRGEK
jgi:hypothetical protein